MANIHNVVSNLIELIDLQNVMTTHIEDQVAGYITIHIHQGHRHLQIEVYEESSNVYTDVGVISYEGFSWRQMTRIMDTFMSCLNSGETDEVGTDSESGTSAGRGTD
jgi:hypothetical protein